MLSWIFSRLSVAPTNFLSSHQFESCVGQGSHGFVLQGVDSRSSDVSVVKFFFLGESAEQGSTLDEEECEPIIQGWTLAIKFDHENIVKTLAIRRQAIPFREMQNIIGNVSTANNPVLLRMLEHCGAYPNRCFEVIGIQMESAGVNLRSWLNQEERFQANLEGKLDLKPINICRDMAAGLKYLHDKGILHRDLKPEHVLFSRPSKSDSEWELPMKICDFSLSGDIEAFQNRRVQNPDGYYIAPELVIKSRWQFTVSPSFKSDIFSLGLIFWEVLQPIRYEERAAYFHQLVDDGKENVVRLLDGMGGVAELIVEMTEESIVARMKSVDKVIPVFDWVIQPSLGQHITKSALDLETRLKNARNGDEIVLGVGVYEGEFVLENDNVSIVGQGEGKTVLKVTGNNTCLKVVGSGCTLKGLDVIAEGGRACKGIDIQGSTNTIINLKVSSDGTSVRVKGNENILEELVVSNGCHGVWVYGAGNRVTNVKMNQIRDTGIGFGGRSTKNIISYVTGTGIRTGIYIHGSHNDLFDINFVKGSDVTGAKGVWLDILGSQNSISNLTTSGYTKANSDWGLIVGSSKSKIKDSECSPVEVYGCESTLTNVNCGELIHTCAEKEDVTLMDCRGMKLKADGKVTTTGCQWDVVKEKDGMEDA